MSWSFYVKGVPVETAKQSLVNDNNMPQGIKDYISTGIDGLVSWHGPDVQVTVDAHGHLCPENGKDVNSYQVTSASIEVKKYSEE